MSTNEWTDTPDSHRLRLCKPDEVRFAKPENMVRWYPQALCFNDRKKVKMTGTWFGADYEAPLIAIAKCRETPERKAAGRKCRPENEIELFLKRHPFFFIY